MKPPYKLKKELQNLLEMWRADHAVQFRVIYPEIWKLWKKVKMAKPE